MTAPQPTLFDEQQAQLTRVTGAIGREILKFLRCRMANGFTQFHADDLRGAVASAMSTAPGSADRVLRDLRKSGLVSYTVVDRRASLYRILRVS